MATEQVIVSNSTPLQKLEEQLTCTSCHQLFTNPKILSCHHSFCQKCLEELLQVITSQFIACPTCCHHTDIPQSTGVAGLPTSNLTKLEDVYCQFKTAGISQHQVTTGCDNCTAANATGYCKECAKYLCQECIDMHKKYVSFSNHQITSLDEATVSPPPSLPHTKQQTPSAKQSVLTALTERENEIKQQGETIKDEIRHLANEVMTVLQDELIKEVETIIETKLNVLVKQRVSFERRVQESMKIGQTCTPEKEEITQHINVHEFSPLVKADIQLIKGSKEFIIKTLHDIIGKVLSSTAVLQECKVKDIDQIEHHPNEKMISFPLSLECPDSSLLTVPFSSIKCSLVPVGSQPITTTVTSTTHPGVYNIHCSPLTRGRHQVNVQVHDIQLEGTSLVIPFNPYLDTIIPVRPIGELDRPWGVAVSNDGHIVVAENGANRVTILNREGKKVKSFTENIPGPAGVAITHDNFILATDSSHKIQKLNMDGKCIKSVGGQGSGTLQFYNSIGITISPITGRVFVADASNHRIQVLTSDLTFCRFIGSNGSDKGQFSYPWDVAINSKGLLYVADRGNDRIQKFTPEGQYVAQFGTKGSGPG